MPAVLYVSYDGILEPLGESQVVSYIEGLASDYAITLLSFEKVRDLDDRPREEQMRRRLQDRNIDWIALKYHKWPAVLSTAFDVVQGAINARRICRQSHVVIIHARSYVPALIALSAKTASGAAFLFDTRGFWVDEKVEAGHWRRGGVLYRVAKRFERRFYGNADAIVSLTHAGVESIGDIGAKLRTDVLVEVIPTCADLQRFKPTPKDESLLKRLGLRSGRIIGCVGTMSNWYMREEMLDCLGQLSRDIDDLQILFVTRDDHVSLHKELLRRGIDPDRVVVTSAAFAEMPKLVALFDAGLFFIRPSLSKRASAATKLAEFLACGVPVIINDGVGDSGNIVRNARAGVVLPELNSSTFGTVALQLLAVLNDPDTAERCRQAARDNFDLMVGTRRYGNLYAHVIGRNVHHPKHHPK